MCKAVIIVNMKNPTIWESASRPLFVRSVWLESTNAGRGHHRHFILDYEPKKRKSLSSPARFFKKTSLEHSVSCDFSDFNLSNSAPDPPEELFLIGSSKAKYQQPPAQQQQKLQQRSAFNYRRPSLATKRYQSLEGFHKRRLTDIPDHYSRRSSLQDLQSSLSNACSSNPDERLAERVLNWLDLAGKTSSILKVVDTNISGEMEPSCNTANKKPAKSRRASNFHTRHLQRSSTALSQQRIPTAAAARKTTKHTLESTAHHRPDSVKHITIIFNKEGVPVRLNRPARNIDLCTMASSAETVRKLAGPLASARLYATTENNSGNCSSRRNVQVSTATAIGGGSSRKHRDLEAAQTPTYASSSAHKRLFDDSNSYQDSKKQLHIFMPSLPKKGLLGATASTGGSSVTAVDDMTSVLSNTFNELCKL